MSEKDILSPTEARDLTEKLSTFAQTLTERQRTYLGGLLEAAGDEDVQGHIYMGGVGGGTTAPTTSNMSCNSGTKACAP